jgi:hypothetical protein
MCSFIAITEGGLDARWLSIERLEFAGALAVLSAHVRLRHRTIVLHHGQPRYTGASAQTNDIEQRNTIEAHAPHYANTQGYESSAGRE